MFSNHASGTVIDLNAPKHPQGRWATFSDAQVAELWKLLTRYEGVIRWGGTCTGTPDEMHFKTDASPSRVKELAARLAFSTRTELWRVSGLPAGLHLPRRAGAGLVQTIVSRKKNGELLHVVSWSEHDGTSWGAESRFKSGPDQYRARPLRPGRRGSALHWQSSCSSPGVAVVRRGLASRAAMYAVGRPPT